MANVVPTITRRVLNEPSVVKIVQRRSSNGSTQDIKGCLRALGLHGPHTYVFHKNNSPVRGMIYKLRKYVDIELVPRPTYKLGEAKPVVQSIFPASHPSSASLMLDKINHVKVEVTNPPLPKGFGTYKAPKKPRTKFNKNYYFSTTAKPQHVSEAPVATKKETLHFSIPSIFSSVFSLRPKHQIITTKLL